MSFFRASVACGVLAYLLGGCGSTAKPGGMESPGEAGAPGGGVGSVDGGASMAGRSGGASAPVAGSGAMMPIGGATTGGGTTTAGEGGAGAEPAGGGATAGGGASPGGSAGSGGTGGSDGGEPKADCDGVPDGSQESRIRYAVASAPSALECQPETQYRVCQDGVWSAWSGSHPFAECTVKGCPALPQTRVRFAQATVDYPASCVAEIQYQSCENGVSGGWTGSFVYETCVVDVKSCGTVPHGSSQTAIRYRAAQVPFGSVCEAESQSRLCINGVFQPWSGSFQAESCVVAPPASCDGGTHGAVEERLRYAKAIVKDAGECSPQTQTRTCTNGVWSSWSGSPEFAEPTCHVEIGGWCSKDDQCVEGACTSASCTCPIHQQPAMCGESPCCECSGKWEGDHCAICPGNFDPEKDCNACRNHWTGNDCERCPAQFSISSDCKACSPGWHGPNCEEQDVCVRFVDPASQAPVQTGYSWSEAFSKIDWALSSLGTRPCQIWVRKGIYTEEVALLPGRALYGGFAGTEQTLSERNPAQNEVILKGRVTGGGLLDGVTFWGGVSGNAEPLTIRGAKFSGFDARLSVYSEVIVEDSVFEDVRGALYVNYSGDATVRRSRFRGVWGSWGSAINVVGAGSSVRLEDSLVVDSFPTGSLFLVEGGASLEVVSSVVTGNETQVHWGTLFSVQTSSLHIVSSTIADNRVKSGLQVGGRLLISAGADAEISSSILWGNPAPLFDVPTGGSLAVTHSLVEGGFAGTGNVTSAPSFVGSGDHPYRLRSGSPGIDAADGDVSPERDLLGASRFDAPSAPNSGRGTPSFVDMGAYEFR